MGKILRISFILLVTCLKQAYSTDAPITTAGTVTTTATTAVVSVTATNFTTIASFHYEIHYDQSIAVATLVTAGPGLGGTFSYNILTAGTIIVSWGTFPLLTLPGNPVILTINFSKVTNGTTALAWYDNGPSCYYAGENYAILNDTPQSSFYFNGSLTFCAPTLAADFSASNTTPPKNATVQFTDLSSGCPTSWAWSFNRPSVTYVNGTTAASQHPQVQFTESGPYTVTLVATNAGGPDTEIKTDYIRVGVAGLWTGTTSTDWAVSTNWDDWLVPVNTTNVVIPASATNWPVVTGDLTPGTSCNSLNLSGASEITVTGNFAINAGSSLTFSNNGTLRVGGNWTNAGTFDAGTGTVIFTGTTPATIINGGSPAVVNNFFNLTVMKEETSLTIPAGTSVKVNGNLLIDPL